MTLLETDRNSLLASLAATVGVVEKRHTLPILSNVLMQNQAGVLSLLATDLELQISTTIQGKAGEDFSVTTGARKLFDIVRALPEGSNVKLDSKDSQLEVRAGKSRFTLQTLPAADFPRMETNAGVTGEVSLTQKNLKRLLQLVQFAMAQQDIRYYLNGMLLVLDGNALRVVATDGHRLSFAETTLENGSIKKEVIIPRKTVIELSKLLQDNEDPVTLRVGDNQVTIELAGTKLVSKIVDGKFPDYQRVIPVNHDKHLVINRQQAVQSLQRAAILSNEKFRGVRLVLGSNSLNVVCNNNEQEEAQEEIEARYDNEALDIGFNVTYLQDGLNALSCEEVTLSFSDPNSSMLLTAESDPGFKYVVMPMRI